MGESCGVGVAEETFTFSFHKCLYIFCCKLTLQLKTLKKSSTIQVQLQFSTRCFLRGLGSQCWKGTQKAADVGCLLQRVEERGYGSWESLAKATPRPVLTWSLACLPALPVFLT